MQNYILLLIAVMCWSGGSLSVWLLLRQVRVLSLEVYENRGNRAMGVAMIALGPITLAAGYLSVFWLWCRDSLTDASLDASKHQNSNRERP